MRSKVSKVKFCILFIAACFSFFIINKLNFPEPSTQMLEDILINEKLKLGKNIFFLDTTSFAKNDTKTPASMSHRYACAVESAARANPNLLVFMVFTDKSSFESSDVITTLLKYPNILFLKLNYHEFVKNTPMEKWMESGKTMRLNFLPIIFQIF